MIRAARASILDRAATRARAALVALVAGCAAHPAPLAADHPAASTAPVGRRAAPPASLAPGVVGYRDLPALPPAADAPAEPPAAHHHH